MQKNHKKKCLVEETIESKKSEDVGNSYDLMEAWECLFNCLNEGIGDPLGLSVDDFQGDPMSGISVDGDHPGVFKVFAGRQRLIPGYLTQQGLQIPVIASRVLELLFDPNAKSLTLVREQPWGLRIDIPLLAENIMTHWEPIVSQSPGCKDGRLVEIPLVKFRMESNSLSQARKAVKAELRRLDFSADFHQLNMPREVLDDNATMLEQACADIVLEKLRVAWEQAK